jgi:hypothetical protein
MTDRIDLLLLDAHLRARALRHTAHRIPVSTLLSTTTCARTS